MSHLLSPHMEEKQHPQDEEFLLRGRDNEDRLPPRLGASASGTDEPAAVLEKLHREGWACYRFLWGLVGLGMLQVSLGSGGAVRLTY